MKDEVDHEKILLINCGVKHCGLIYNKLPQ